MVYEKLEFRNKGTFPRLTIGCKFLISDLETKGFSDRISPFPVHTPGL